MLPNSQTYLSVMLSSDNESFEPLNPLTMCMKFSKEAYRLIFNFCDASPLMMIQSTIFFKMYFKLKLFVFGVNAKFDELIFDEFPIAREWLVLKLLGVANPFASMATLAFLYQCRSETSICSNVDDAKRPISGITST